jgi:DNA-directed RNA polymerase subunit omega
VARITVEDCLETVPNRFALVMLVAKRTKQLMKGVTATVSAKNNKKVVQALREVAAGYVRFDGIDADKAEIEISADLKK